MAQSKKPAPAPTPASNKSAPATISTGKCAIWFLKKGFGFISPDSGGDDIFCHWSEIIDGVCLHKGATVKFLREMNTNGKERAKNVTGGAQKSAPCLPPKNTKTYKGKVCVWKKSGGFGFIKPQEGGKDVFCHHVDILDGDYLEPGKEVDYCLEYNVAKNKYSAKKVGCFGCGLGSESARRLGSGFRVGFRVSARVGARIQGWV